MDPLAHTLVGATLAETGLKRKTPLAATTSILGANAPDIDALVGITGSDASLLLRRGWTHGVFAMAVLPVLLAGMMYGIGRWRSARGKAPPPHFGALLLVAVLSVLTHPFLDWLNTYGVRLLMPFDGRWFYGDALFILDPWMWLLGASAVVLATSRGALGIGAWCILGAGTSALVLGYPGVPWGTRLVWSLGVAGIIALRARRGREQLTRRVARIAIVTAGAYALAMVGGSMLAREQATRWLAGTGVAATHAVAKPLPGDPFVREVTLVGDAAYHIVEVQWLPSYSIRYTQTPLARPNLDDPRIAAALALPDMRGFADWMRLPFVEVEPVDAGHRLTLYDLRYARPGDKQPAAGFARRVVELDDALQRR